MPRGARFILVGLVACTLVLVTIVSTYQIQRLARADRTWVFSTAQPRWIDENANGPVTYIYAETAVPQMLWKTVYWNERIDRVLEFDGVPPAAPLPTRRAAPRCQRADPGHSRTPTRGGYVVAPSNIVLAGTELASYGPAADIPGLTLWRADAPLRVRWITTGVQTNGDIAGAARVQVPGCTRGHLSLTLLSRPPRRQRRHRRRVRRSSTSRASAPRSWAPASSAPGLAGRRRWKGWWGPNPPFHTPTFVLTHRPRPSIEMEGGTTFHFLDASPAEALDAAREAAGGRDVRIGGGPTVVRDFLAAGLVDHMHLVQVPIVLGRGVRLWDGLEGAGEATTRSRPSRRPAGSPT